MPSFSTHVLLTRQRAGLPGSHLALACTAVLGLGLVPGLGTGPARAQESATDANRDSAPVEAEDPSRETDVSEDNYRRYMELRDLRLERPAFPAATLKPSSLQKLGELPESSQKHLRNQLRGIILQRGAWTPAERDRDYPFVPSAAARGDAQLLRGEADAWAELVAEYHDREEASLAARNSRLAPGAPGAPTSAEALAADGERGAPGESGSAGGGAGRGGGQGEAGEANEGEGQSGEGGSQGNEGQAGEDGAEQDRQQTEVAEETPPDRRRVPEFPDEEPPTDADSAMSDEGVSESAAAFLRRQGLAGDAPAGDRPGTPAGDTERPDPGRWGEASTTLLPPPAEPIAEAPATPPGPAETPDVTADRSGLLTLEELRRARGVGPNAGDDALGPDPENEGEVGDAFGGVIDISDEDRESPEPRPEDRDG